MMLRRYARRTGRVRPIAAVIVALVASCNHEASIRTLPSPGPNATSWTVALPPKRVMAKFECAADRASRNYSGVFVDGNDHFVISAGQGTVSRSYERDGRPVAAGFAMVVRAEETADGTVVTAFMRSYHVVSGRRFGCAHGSPGMWPIYVHRESQGVEEAAFLTELRHCLGDVGDPPAYHPPVHASP